LSRYRRIRLIGLVAALFFVMGQAVFAQSEGNPIIKIKYTESSVRIQKPASEGWLTADTGTVLSAQDKIATGDDSRGIVEIFDSQIVRLGPRSTLLYTGVDSLGPTMAPTFYAGAGDLWANLGATDNHHLIEYIAHFRNGVAKIAPIFDSLPAIFRAEIGADSSLELKIYRGAIHIALGSLGAVSDSPNTLKFPEYNAAGIYGDALAAEHAFIISSYQKIILTSSGEIVYKGAFASTDPDEQTLWVKWNCSLDSFSQQ